MARPGRQGKQASTPVQLFGEVVAEMRYLDLTLPTMAENLALDEALLDEAEDSNHPLETVRVWQPTTTAVVLGRSSRRRQEVDEAGCLERGVEIFRRSSGGLSILTGPGCLMYAVVVNISTRPELKSIPLAHQFVLGKLSTSLASYFPDVSIRGTSDLVAGNQKFSGNSLRVKRTHLLYHGTLLYDFPLDWIGACLLPPPRAPDYREGRAHTDFVMNLPLSRIQLQAAVQRAFLPTTSFTAASSDPAMSDLVPSNSALSEQALSEQTSRADWPQERTARLVTERFLDEAWTNAF